MHRKQVLMNTIWHSYKCSWLSTVKCFHSLQNSRQPLGSCATRTISYAPLISVRTIGLNSKPSCFIRYLSNQMIGPDVDNKDISKSSTETDSASGSEGAKYENSNVNVTHDLFDSIDYEKITGGDPELLNKFKLLLLEVDVLRQDGENVPKHLSTEQWMELFSLTTRSQRRKCLQFLWLREMRQLSDEKKKEKRRLETMEKKQQLLKEHEKDNHILYGFNGNTIFVRVYDTTINLFDNSRLVQAMQFSQSVIIDCGYSKDMTMFENKLTAKQLCFMFAENRLHRDPLNLQFCNLKKDGILYQQFKKYIPTLEEPSFPINLNEDSYLNLYPKDKLVYLTPHCRTELREYSHDDVYIIGALVDRQNNQPLSLAKAKSEGIRMACLPIDRYLKWHLGTKSLTINQILNILLDMRFTGDWNLALQHVPKRKLCDPSRPFEDHRRVRKRGTTLQPPKYWRG